MRLRSWVLPLVLLLAASAALGVSVHPTESQEIFRLILELASEDEARIAAAKEALIAKGERAAPFLIDALLEGGRESMRAEAADVLGQIRCKEGLTPLFVASANDPSGRVREAAALARARLVADLQDRPLEDPLRRDYARITRKDIAALKKELRDDSNPQARALAARALGVYGEADDILFLCERAEEDDEPEVRIACWEAACEAAYPIILDNVLKAHKWLTRHGVRSRTPDMPACRDLFAKKVVESMLDGFSHEVHSAVRVALTDALTECVYPIFLLDQGHFIRGGSQFVEYHWIIFNVPERWCAYLESEGTSAQGRLAVIGSLTRLLCALYHVGDIKDQDAARNRLLRDYVRRKRRRSIHWVAPTIGAGSAVIHVRPDVYVRFRGRSPGNDPLSEKATKVMKPLYRTDPDWRVRQAAVEAIGYFGQPSDSIEVRRGLPDQANDDVLEAAVYALGGLGQATSAKYLFQQAIANPRMSNRLRAAAARAIGAIHYPPTSRQLAAWLAREESVEVRVAILEGLSYWREHETARAIATQLGHAEAEVRIAALVALRYNPCAEAYDQIERLVTEDPDTAVRVSALITMAVYGRLPHVPVQSLPAGERETVAALMRRLKDEQAGVRQPAAEKLGLHKVSRAVKLLIKVVTGDPDSGVRMSGARALGRIGDPKAIDPLVQQILKEKDVQNRVAIYEALVAIRHESQTIVAIKQHMPWFSYIPPGASPGAPLPEWTREMMEKAVPVPEGIDPAVIFELNELLRYLRRDLDLG